MARYGRFLWRHCELRRPGCRWTSVAHLVEVRAGDGTLVLWACDRCAEYVRRNENRRLVDILPLSDHERRTFQDT